MSDSTPVEALVKAHASGDDAQFYSVALGYASRLRCTGSYEAGELLYKTIEEVRGRLDLSLFSTPDACSKCRGTFGDGHGITDRFMRVGAAEFLERQCQHCGYTWHEQCADARGSR